MIRSLPDYTHRALKFTAMANRTSVEAVVRRLLDEAMMPGGRLQMGYELSRIGRMADGGFTLPMLNAALR